MQDGHFSELYTQTIIGEKETKELLIEFEKDYPGVTEESNVNEIAENLQKKSSRASVLAKLRERKSKCLLWRLRINIASAQEPFPTRMSKKASSSRKNHSHPAFFSLHLPPQFHEPVVETSFVVFLSKALFLWADILSLDVAVQHIEHTGTLRGHTRIMRNHHDGRSL